MFGTKEEKEIKKLMKDWDVKYHFNHLTESLASKGYLIRCIKLKKILERAIVVDEC